MPSDLNNHAGLDFEVIGCSSDERMTEGMKGLSAVALPAQPTKVCTEPLHGSLGVAFDRIVLQLREQSIVALALKRSTLLKQTQLDQQRVKGHVTYRITVFHRLIVSSVVDVDVPDTSWGLLDVGKFELTQLVDTGAGM